MIIRIGTRGSALALAQTHEACTAIQKADTKLELRVIPIKTTGDKITKCSLTDIGGKGLFIREIALALLNNEIDIAVHSMKDVPAFYSQELCIPCILKREDPSEAFISYKYSSIDNLPLRAVIATCSVRRKVQLLNIRPDLQIVMCRGNVPTRIKKLFNGIADGMILAVAGLKRLNLMHHITQVIQTARILPAIAQGAIGLQCHRNNSAILSLLQEINDKDCFTCINTERIFMQTIGGDCDTPMAALTEFKNNDQLSMRCMLADRNDKIYHAQESISKSRIEIVSKQMATRLLTKIS